MPAVVSVTLGSSLWLDGERWEVVALTGSDAVLRSDGRLQRIRLGELAARADVFGSAGTIDPCELDVLSLSQLSAAQRRDVERRLQTIADIVAETESGARSLGNAIEVAASKSKVSGRTIERWLTAYRLSGVAGLVQRKGGGPAQARSQVDPRWDTACVQVLASYVQTSTPTRGAVIAEIAYVLGSEFGEGTVPLPARTTAYERLAELSKGRHAFGSAKARRSVAGRPSGPFGRLRATRPGEYVVLDTTPLDVFAMEPVTLRWVGVELTVAMDLFSRCILGLTLTPVSTKAADVANVLYQCIAPPRNDSTGSQIWPHHGVPGVVLLGHEQPRTERLPSCMPGAIVVDHGRQYLSAHVMGACERMGISVQPAIPNKPTDKPTVERFFRSLRESLLQHLPAYKGPDVFSRGKDIEDQAFFYVSELEQIIREWVGEIYHQTRHDGLCVPELPGLTLSPSEMFEAGVAKSGGLQLLADPNIGYEFLGVRWRTIQHYGVEVDGRRYDGAALNMYRTRRSSYSGVHAGKWPIFVDAHDIRYVHFQAPDSKTWHILEWEHAAGLHQPFGQDAAAYVKRISVRDNRHVDPARAVRELLMQWSRDEVSTRRDRSLARRLSAQRASTHGSFAPTDTASDRDSASLPAVIDLLDAEHPHLQTQGIYTDDVDVFAAFYEENPDTDGLEVLDQ
jgi:putative transposase